MSFQDNLINMPAIDHLIGLDICDEEGEILHHIPAVQGKLGSLKLYHALAQEFDYQLNAQAAERGLALFAEHVADAQNHPGKHPNIELLFKAKAENVNWHIKPLLADSSSI